MSPPRSTAERGRQSELLTYLKSHYGDFLRSIVCLDLTLYEHGQDSLPIFHLISPSPTLGAYKQIVKELVTPTRNSEGNLESSSIAIHQDFLQHDRMCILPVNGPEFASSLDYQIGLNLEEEHYPMRDYSPQVYRAPTELTVSLRRFQTLLAERRSLLRSLSGKPINLMVCCNFRAAEKHTSFGFRTLGQLFLGLSSVEFDGETLPDAAAKFLLDLSILLYRSNASALFFGQGQVQSLDTFSHEAKKLVQLVKEWPKPPSRFEDSNGRPLSVSAIRMTGIAKPLPIEQISILPFPQYFDTAVAQMLLWTMADSMADLPFYAEDATGNATMPSIFSDLATKCFNVARMQVFFAFARAFRFMAKDFSALTRFQQYLDSKLPRLLVTGDASDILLDWRDECAVALTNLSRLMIVAAREALQHGDWSAAISFRLAFSTDKDYPLQLEINNQRINEWKSDLFRDSLSAVGIQTELLMDVRKKLHQISENYSRNGRQGRKQIQVLATAALGRVDRQSSPNAPSHELWAVVCSFPERAFLFRKL